MKTPPLFPESELVSDRTRQLWRQRIDFLWEHGKHINEWESGFLTSIKAWLASGRDLTLDQSLKLSKIYHREEERLG